MKIVVTGARGFVGRHLVNHLYRIGHHVGAVDIKGIASDEKRDGLCHIVGDIRNPQELREHLDGTDAVIHLASAHLDVRLSEEAYWETNVNCIRPLLKIANEARVRHWVRVSTVGVHGSVAKIPGDENSPLAPLNIYDRTKAAGENEIRDFINQGNPMAVTIVRPVWIYGESDSRTEKLLRTVSKGTFALFGKGVNYRHPMHIDDFLRGLDAIVMNARAFGKTYVLGGPEFLTSSQLVKIIEKVTCGKVRLRLPLLAGYFAGLCAEMVCKPFGSSPPLSRRTLVFFTANMAFCTAAAESDLQFKPKIFPLEGFAEVWEKVKNR